VVIDRASLGDGREPCTEVPAAEPPTHLALGEQPIEDLVGHGLRIDLAKNASRCGRDPREVIAIDRLEDRAVALVEGAQPCGVPSVAIAIGRHRPRVYQGKHGPARRTNGEARMDERDRQKRKTPGADALGRDPKSCQR
jgi:hypothetical protein